VTAQLVEGALFSGAPRVLSAARILAFSGGPFDAPGWPAKNLHTDAAKAAEAGLAEPIVSGIQCEADVVRLLASLFGDLWYRRGRLSVKYPRVVTAGMTIRAHARVKSVGEGTIELEVWCDTPDGTMVVVGTAGCDTPVRG